MKFKIESKRAWENWSTFIKQIKFLFYFLFINYWVKKNRQNKVYLNKIQVTIFWNINFVMKFNSKLNNNIVAESRSNRPLKRNFFRFRLRLRCMIDNLSKKKPFVFRIYLDKEPQVPDLDKNVFSSSKLSWLFSLEKTII